MEGAPCMIEMVIEWASVVQSSPLTNPFARRNKRAAQLSQAALFYLTYARELFIHDFDQDSTHHSTCLIGLCSIFVILTGNQCNPGLFLMFEHGGYIGR